jgi:aryl-alcohol dehydrogenase-like predicted oxidoreductase
MFTLPTTILGRTGLTVTRLGIGGAYCQTPEGYIEAINTGVNYIDTAPAYHDGADEGYVGKAIQGRRHNLVIATKTMKRTADEVLNELETSLKLLQTDYIDIWQMHYVNKVDELERILGPGGAMETVIKAREQGKIRFVGVTGHAWASVSKAVATGLFDTVLCWYSCAKREPEENVFVQAAKHNTGVVIMNATGTDKLLEGENAPPFANFYRYVLGHPRVNVVLRGMRDVSQFYTVAKALAERSTLSPDERVEIEKYGARMRKLDPSAD